MATGTNSLDDFLAEITALGEVQGVGQLGFLRKIFVRDVDAVQRARIEDAGGFDFVFAGFEGARVLQGFAENGRVERAEVDVVAVGSGVAGFDDQTAGPIGGVVVVDGHGGPDGFQNIFRGWSFQGECRLLFGGVFERDIVSDDELIQMGKNGLGLGGLDVEEQMVTESENRDVGEDAALGAQEKRVAALAGFELLDVVGGHGVEEAFAILAKNFDAAAAREFEERHGIEESIEHGGYCVRARRAAETRITLRPETTSPVNMRARFSGVVLGLTRRIDTAAMCRKSRNLMPKSM